MFTKVLVPLDQSSLAEQAVGTAAAIARASHGEIGLVVAHEMLPYDGFLDASWRDAKDPAENIYVRALAEEVAKGAGVTVSAAVETGHPVEVIGRRAREIGADLIVMTSHGRTGLSRAWLGSVADGVVRSAPAPVLMLRPTETKGLHPVEPGLFHRLLVPLDGSASSATILGAATSMAQCTNGVLILARVVLPIPLYVYDPGMPSSPTALMDPESTDQAADIAREELSAMATRVERDTGLRVETEVVIADQPARALLDMAVAKQADLIAMTAHGRGASRLIVGSVTDKVLRGSHLPLLLLHPQPAAHETITARTDAVPEYTARA